MSHYADYEEGPEQCRECGRFKRTLYPTEETEEQLKEDRVPGPWRVELCVNCDDWDIDQWKDEPYWEGDE